MTDLQGKVALITGAAGDIGAAIARHFVGAGARVALADKNAPAVRRIAQEIGEAARWHECDVSDECSMVKVVQAAEDEHGRIDIGILNAGISLKRTPLKDMETATYDRIMAVNARGVFLGLKHLFPALKRVGGGSIVVTSSTEGLRGNAGIAPYVASIRLAFLGPPVVEAILAGEICASIDGSKLLATGAIAPSCEEQAAKFLPRASL